jgi:hypothetical protein
MRQKLECGASQRRAPFALQDRVKSGAECVEMEYV